MDCYPGQLRLVCKSVYSPKCVEERSSTKLGKNKQKRRVKDFKDGQDKHQGRVFFSDGGSVNLVSADADRVIAALEDFAGYPRI